MAIIETDNLTKVFGGLKAVDHVTFTVEEGEIFGLLGPNGAGKTTTIKMLTTLLRPTDGRAIVAGYDVVKEASKVRNVIGLVPQELTVDDELTGWDNIMLQATLYHLPEEEGKKRARELLELVGLTDSAKKRVKTYSGGMRKRLELVEGLIHHPRLVFLDEPTLGLDVQTRKAIWDYIRYLNRELGMTVFLTTHYMEEADGLCGRISIIDYGKIVSTGMPQELRRSVGGDVVSILFDGDQSELSLLLNQLPFVREVAHDGETYRLEVESGEEDIPKVFEQASKIGAVVKRVSLSKPSLDEVYLKITGKSFRDEDQRGIDRRAVAFTRRRLGA